MKRYFYLGLGSLAMCVFGLMYNWTVFAGAVSAELNVSAGQLLPTCSQSARSVSAPAAC